MRFGYGEAELESLSLSGDTLRVFAVSLPLAIRRALCGVFSPHSLGPPLCLGILSSLTDERAWLPSIVVAKAICILCYCRNNATTTFG